MRPVLPVLVIIALLLISGCVTSPLPGSPRDASSYPGAAGMYPDLPGNETVPTLAGGIPFWQNNPDLCGQGDRCPAGYSPLRSDTKGPLIPDMPGNASPVITIFCTSDDVKKEAPWPVMNLTQWKSDCFYEKSSPIHLSGTAVGPDPESAPNITFQIKNVTSEGFLDGYPAFFVQARNDFTYEYLIRNPGLPAGHYILSATLPSGHFSTVNFTIGNREYTNISVLEQIVEDFHKTNAISGISDICSHARLAQDLWGLVNAKGVRALLVGGDADNPAADWTNYDRTWVVAEVLPGQWVALDATMGTLVYRQDNPLYYTGIIFENPADMQTWIRLRPVYFTQLKKVETIRQQRNATMEEYASELRDYNELLADYNNNYANRLLLPQEYPALQVLKSRLAAKPAKLKKIKDELDQLTSSSATEKQQLDDLLSQINRSGSAARF